MDVTREHTFDLGIVGAGAAGLTAAMQVAAAGFGVALIEGADELGGEGADMARLEAVPGFPIGLSGAELVERTGVVLRQQAVAVRTGTRVTSVGRRSDGWELLCDQADPIRCRAVLAASGAGPALIDVPGSRRFSGAGVYAGVPATPPPGWLDRTVFVIGTVRVAAEAALRLAPFCSGVVVLSSEPEIGARLPAATVRDVRATQKISARLSVDLVELVGVRHLEAIVLRDRRTGRTTVREATALIIAGPGSPASRWLADSGALLRDGHVVTGPRTNGDASRAWTGTTVNGLFAAGAVRAGCGAGVAGAIADGLAAAHDIIGYLTTRPEPHRAPAQ